ncbi:hypothetical protein [Klebsiella michiganensis]|uniref:hypothetical protein n=1 Tax=Klebsiella michiganensis TaxID=1134687 RepID=UPI00255A8ADB|nr:hypothetical protein [Klebsiella michiganensis]MDL4446674.1 hypothetical protein [Klebsiella michiganensis]MDL4490530.1 hypothetical protein [Klebsiella michiganensis]MDL4659273.1 hypothetical protein [Klebsiella michiganensis]
MSQGGGDQIQCGLRVGFNSSQQSIAMLGMNQSVLLKQGDVACVMNANGFDNVESKIGFKPDKTRGGKSKNAAKR